MAKRDDLTIQEITVSNPGEANAVPLVLPTRYNIVLVNLGNDVNPYFVNLPADADSAVGDHVEFYIMNRAGDSNALLHINDSNGIQFFPDRGPQLITSGWGGASVRKIAIGLWR